MSQVQSGELIEFDNGLMGIVLNLEEDNVGAVLLGSSNKVREGDTVKRTGEYRFYQCWRRMLDALLTLSVFLSMVKVHSRRNFRNAY